jgi:hypothetical protein
MSISFRSPPFDALLRRVRGEYREMPGLRLTPSQAQRFFGLAPLTCAAMLEALEQERFLFRTSDGLFCDQQYSMSPRLTEGRRGLMNPQER